MDKVMNSESVSVDSPHLKDALETNQQANNTTKETKMAEHTTHNIFKVPTDASGYAGMGGLGGLGAGGIGGFLLGALLSRGTGLFGGTGEGVNQISQQMLSQDLGDIKAEVATSALETQKAVAASNMDVNATLFNQSAAIQNQLYGNAINTANGFANTNQNLAAGFSNVINTVDNTRADIKNAIFNDTISNLRGFAEINSLAAVNNAQIQKSAAENALITERTAYQTTQAIRDDGDKTRALITSQYEATLNRQLSDANNAIIELRNEGRIRDSGITVTNNINQNQAQAQAQVQLQNLTGLVGVLANEIQRNSQSIVNLGTMSSGAGQQSAANTRVNWINQDVDGDGDFDLIATVTITTAPKTSGRKPRKSKKSQAIPDMSDSDYR